MLTGDGKPSLVFRTGEPFAVRVPYRVRSRVRKPVFGLGIFRADGTYVNGSNHAWRDRPIRIEGVEAGETGEARMEFDSMPVLPGQYYLTVYLYEHSHAAPTPIDQREHAVTFEVLDARQHQHGIVSLPTHWSVRRRRPGRSGPDAEELLDSPS